LSVSLIPFCVSGAVSTQAHTLLAPFVSRAIQLGWRRGASTGGRHRDPLSNVRAHPCSTTPPPLIEECTCAPWHRTTPLVLGYHPLSVWVFIFIWVVLLVEEHSGHDVSWAPYNWMPFASCPMGGGGAPHDIHHYKVNKNYGFVLCVWDHMLGTFEPVAT
jgi:hypothetical protein